MRLDEFEASLGIIVVLLMLGCTVGTLVLLEPITRMGTLCVSTYVLLIPITGTGMLLPILRVGTLCVTTHLRAAGSRLWNSLPSDVVDCQTVDTFRRRLKHFFFNVSFS